jgi:hypothetical protein
MQGGFPVIYSISTRFNIKIGLFYKQDHVALIDIFTAYQTAHETQTQTARLFIPVILR